MNRRDLVSRGPFAVIAALVGTKSAHASFNLDDHLGEPTRVLFNGTSGKLVKNMTTTGFLKGDGTWKVYDGTPYIPPTSDKLVNKTLITHKEVFTFPESLIDHVLNTHADSTQWKVVTDEGTLIFSVFSAQQDGKTTGFIGVSREGGELQGWTGTVGARTHLRDFTIVRIVKSFDEIQKSIAKTELNITMKGLEYLIENDPKWNSATLMRWNESNRNESTRTEAASLS